ncbi:MAG: DNA primase [Erysipelotrichales bacterium]|nr:DNA primase [Erysipelotrichales bacterium]
MAGLANEEINRIQQAANIVEIIGSYVNLEKQGKNYFCICPFHDDHNPSMSVSEEKGLYTCFVCHKTGNVFSFVRDFENVSFIEAVKIVASKVGIEFETGYKETNKYDKHYEAIELALKFYQNNLKSEDGKKAREYLKRRGITDEIIEEFNIGFAPNSYDTITKLLINKGFDEELLISTGLAARNNTVYDLFRNRITFPIHNPQGKPVGFSSRIYEDVNEAKYINTKETAIFKKGKILFNYHRAQNEARRLKYLLVVEGQMDAIRVYSSGIKNVVATMGTALTEDHIKLLKKLNVKIVLCMDNDEAGEKATIQNGEALSQAGVDLAVLRISDAKDPDEYILKHSKDEFVDAINNAVTYFDFKLNYFKKDKNLNKVEDVSKYINQIVKELNKSNDEVLIDLTVNELSSQYGIDKNVLLNQIIKVEAPKITKIEQKKEKKLSKNQRLASILLYYMMNDTKYIKLYEQELGYIPDDNYGEIANDILAFFLKYNYINIADFITYEISKEYYENVLDIIDTNIKVELNDAEYVGIINKIKIWIDENKINELKEKVKSISDINEQLKIADEIAKIKKRMCQNEES